MYSAKLRSWLPAGQHMLTEQHELFDLMPIGTNGYPGIWVRGGTTTQGPGFRHRRARRDDDYDDFFEDFWYDTGAATIVTTSDGSKPRAIYRRKSGFFKGRHALVPVEVGYYIIDVGHYNETSWLIRVFQVVRVLTQKADGECGIDVKKVFESVNSEEPYSPAFPALDAPIDLATNKAIGGGAVLPYVENDFTLDEWFAPLDGLMESLEEQLETLRRFNCQYWNNILPDDTFRYWSRRISRMDPHQQRVYSLKVLHVSFGSALKDTLMWGLVFAGEYGSFCHAGVSGSFADLQYSDRAARYTRGIQPVTLNLVANWQPNEVSGVAGIYPGKEAGSEIFSACGLNPKLFGEVDRLLPYPCLRGLRIGREWLELHSWSSETNDEWEPWIVSASGDEMEMHPDWAFPTVLEN